MQKETTERRYLVMPDPTLMSERSKLQMLMDAMEYIRNFDPGKDDIHSIEIKINLCSRVVPSGESIGKKSMVEQEKTRTYINSILDRVVGHDMDDIASDLWMDSILALFVVGYGADKIYEVLHVKASELDHSTVSINNFNELLHQFDYKFTLEFDPSGEYNIYHLRRIWE